MNTKDQDSLGVRHQWRATVVCGAWTGTGTSTSGLGRLAVMELNLNARRLQTGRREVVVTHADSPGATGMSWQRVCDGVQWWWWNKTTSCAILAKSMFKSNFKVVLDSRSRWGTNALSERRWLLEGVHGMLLARLQQNGQFRSDVPCDGQVYQVGSLSRL